MQYLLTEEENTERLKAIQAYDELLQARRALKLARELILIDYKCHNESGEEVSGFYCDDCPLGKLLLKSGVEYGDWKTICGRKARFSK